MLKAGFIAFIKVAIPVAVIAAIGIFIFLAWRNGWGPFGRGSEDGSGESNNISQQAEPDPEDPEDSSNIVIPEDEPPLLIIEIRELKIFYDDIELSLEELEEILQKYESSELIWTLHDYYRADKSVYDSVKELFEKLDIVYREH